MVSARFVADMTSFDAAIAKSTVQLRSFETGAEKVEKQLNRTADSFSGRKIISEALLATKAVEDMGGASKLTEQEARRLNTTLTEAISKYKALGQEAPKSMKDLAAATAQPTKALGAMEGAAAKLGAALLAAFSVRAVINFAKGMGEFAGQIIDLNAQTQISTDRLQAFNYAGLGVGLTLEDITGSAEKLAKRVAGDDKSATDAFERLGLSIEEFKQLSLDEQLFQVSDAFEGVTNQSERTLLAVELFGKSGPRMLRLFQDGLKDTITEIEKVGPIIDKQMLQSADAFADAWAQGFQTFTAAVYDAISALGKLGAAVGRSFKGTGTGNLIEDAFRGAVPTGFPEAGKPVGAASVETNAQIVRTTKAVASYAEQLASANTALDKLTKTERANLEAALELGVQHDKIAKSFKLTEGAVGLYVDRLRDAATANTKGESAAKKHAEALKKQNEAMQEDIASAILAGHVYDMTTQELKKWNDAQDDAIASAILAGHVYKEPTAALKKWNEEMQESQTSAILAGHVYDGLAKTFGTLGDTVINGFDKMFVGAISFKDGFLDIWKSLQAGVSNILTAILNDFTGRFLKGMLGAMSGRAGAMSGAFAGMLGGGAKAAGGTAVGGGTAAGVAGGIGMGTAIAATGGIAAAAILAWAIAKKGLFRGGEEALKVSPARDQFINASGGVAKLAEQAKLAGTNLDKLFAAQKVKDFEAALAELNGKLGEFASDQEADAQRLTAAIQKYGFAFEQLGPAFQRQELDKQAKELIEDWRVLVASGIDLGLVNEKMADSVNEYLKMALRVGSEVPNSLRPVLQKMLEQGVLTDEAGVAITDLESAGIHFASTMTEGFEKVVKKLDELIAKLVAAGTAIGNLPTDIKIPGAGTDAGDLNQGGGEWQSFAGGTRGRYLNFGPGTPVMLHGKERVMTEGEGGGDSGLLNEFRGLRAEIIQAMTTTALMARDQSMLARGRGASYA